MIMTVVVRTGRILVIQTCQEDQVVVALQDVQLILAQDIPAEVESRQVDAVSSSAALQLGQPAAKPEHSSPQ